MANPAPMMPVTASAPGKLLLAGEYAVLDGAPAVCMAVDRRALVRISPAAQNHHTVTAPGFCSTVGRFKAHNDDLEWLAGEDDFRLVDHVWRSAGVAATGSLAIVLDTNEFLDAESDTKIGIGSSAALTVALVAAVCELLETDGDATGIASAAHRQFQGGRGSGADVACCAAGGLIEYRKGGKQVQRIMWPEGLAYTILWSGIAASTGGKLERLAGQRARPSRAALVHAATRVAKAWRDASVQSILDEYRDYTKALGEFSIDHALGIFDAGHAELVAAADAAGLVYKPCGAGGGDIGIVFADDAAAIRAFVSDAMPKNFRALNMSIDPCGVRVCREEH